MAEPKRGRDRQREDRALDRLAEPGPTRVDSAAAMRVRDVSRPSAADLVAAAAELELRRARRPDR
jgi:hypothetical protein